MSEKGGFIIAGLNYGQGSSREHAEMCIRDRRVDGWWKSINQANEWAHEWNLNVKVGNSDSSVIKTKVDKLSLSIEVAPR